MKGALDTKPRVREDVDLVRHEQKDGVRYVARLEDGRRYLQFGEAEARLIGLMDGSRTPEQISWTAERELGLRVSAGQVADFAQKLKRQGVVQRTPAERHVMAMERLRAERRSNKRARTAGSILRVRFSLGDPDAWFTSLTRVLSPLWSPAFVVASAAMFLVYGVIATRHFDRIWSGTVDLYLIEDGYSVLALFLAVVLVLGVIHELGHGLTTKRFGGSVHEIGGMLMNFMPAFYCNTNDAWSFPRRDHRLWVAFSGPWIELLVASFAIVVWLVTEPGLLHEIAFLTALAGGVGSVLTNLNPFLPLDGYYALSDWLEIPNLRRRAFAYWKDLLRRALGGKPAEAARVTPRERRVFLLYGAPATLFTAAVVVLGAGWLLRLGYRVVGPWVVPFALAAAGMVFARSAGRIGGSVRRGLRLAGERLRGRAAWGALLVVLVVPFVLPWTFRARGELEVVASPRTVVRARVSGALDGLAVRSGETVREGEAVARLWNPDVVEARVRQEAGVRRLEMDRSRGRAAGDAVALAVAEAGLEEAERSLAALERLEALQVVQAPSHGVVLARRLHERLGAWIESGETLFEIAPPGAREARIRIPTRHASDLRAGQLARMRLVADPSVEFEAPITSVSPAADAGWVELRVPFPEVDVAPLPGSTGVAKVAMWRGTVAEAVVRKIRQTLRIDLWL